VELYLSGFGPGFGQRKGPVLPARAAACCSPAGLRGSAAGLRVSGIGREAIGARIRVLDGGSVCIQSLSIKLSST